MATKLSGPASTLASIPTSTPQGPARRACTLVSLTLASLALVSVLLGASLAAGPAWGAEAKKPAGKAKAAAHRQAQRPVVHLNSPAWLGYLHLKRDQLERIRKATIKALDAPIDEEIQCGKVYMDCTVRAAKEWIEKGVKYRQIVIVLHKGPQGSGGWTGSKAFAMNVVRQVNGRWPEIRI